LCFDFLDGGQSGGVVGCGGSLGKHAAAH
jgi:hypothetical protein